MGAPRHGARISSGAASQAAGIAAPLLAGEVAVVEAQSQPRRLRREVGRAQGHDQASRQARPRRRRREVGRAQDQAGDKQHLDNRGIDVVKPEVEEQRQAPAQRAGASSAAGRWDAHKKPRPPLHKADAVVEVDDGKSSTGSNDGDGGSMELDEPPYAGPGFIVSPEPSMLPMPTMFMVRAR
ncbi:hypothetical protein ACP70R_046494 [Stipagrostis hirtigluma subsp. patula]